MAIASGPPVVVGVDIGTTATKAVAYDVDGRAHGSGSAGYPLHDPTPGAAVQAPEAVRDAVDDAVAEAVVGVDRPVAAVAVGAAMHGLLARDAAGAALTPLITWADTRAADTARALRDAVDVAGLHRRTGTPVHPMSPLVKLAWLRRERPSLHAAAARWGGIAEFVLEGVVGEGVTDASSASGTGLRALSGSWDPEALALAGVDAAHLDRLVAPGSVIGPARVGIGGLPVGTPVVAGAGDGPLASLGLGAVRPGVLACSIGTGGAVRLTVDRPGVDPRRRLFCYELAAGRWVTGGAITNGGLVLDWARSLLGGTTDELLDRAAAVPAGADGLVALPHLLGERAPRWEPSGAGAALVGLRRSHGPGHVVRALLEGVCLALRQVLDAVRDAGHRVDEVRATGGFTRSPFWRQLLCDALAVPVTYPDRVQGSAFGAALLAMQGVGLRPAGPDGWPDTASAGTTLVPGPDAAVLARRLPLLDRLPTALPDALDT